jgi:hypothetical protein
MTTGWLAVPLARFFAPESPESPAGARLFADLIVLLDGIIATIIGQK